MKILIVSGFLGAGKTTFIQTMAAVTGRDFAVYENEYAGAGIDTTRLAENESLNIWESTENCVCCSGKADFAAAVLTISNAIDPEYLIVEPTGAAKLSNLLENVRKIQYDRISLLKPIVIVDAVAYYQSRQMYPDISEDQIRAASVVVLSKTQNVFPEEVQRLSDDIRALNPDAEIVAVPYEKLDADRFMKFLNNDLGNGSAVRASGSSVASGMSDASGSPAAPEHLPESLALLNVSLPTPVHLIAFLDMAAAGEFGKIFRAKGCLPCGREWIRFDLTGSSWAITGSEPLEKAECAVIGDNISRSRIRRYLQEDLLSI